MSFHVKRSQTAKHEILSQYNGIMSTHWIRPPYNKSFLEVQTTHTPTALQKIPEDKNYLTPPYHWHWYQDEYFNITQGRYIFTVDGKVMTKSAADPQPIHVPAKTRHTFRVDDTHEGVCSVEISTLVSPKSSPEDPEANGANEKFFRNIHSYLDDCYTQKVNPSLPQLLLMLDSAETSLAFTFGPAWLMRAMSYAMGVVIGRWFGGYVLGYKTNYAEYYDDGFSGKKNK